MRWIALITLFATAANGATWYVDKDAVGSNNGTSWANAWTNLDVISVSGLSAGDDVQIAEGIYKGPPNLNKAGNAANPIVFHLAQDPTKVGHVFITNGINLYANWIHFNGCFNSNAAVPSAVMALDSITNNIGLHITTENLGSTSGFNCANGNRTGLRILWTHIYKCGALTAGFPADTEPPEHAISLSDYMTNMVIAYCWFQDNIYGDTINSPRDFGTFGELSVHDCLMYNCGDDIVQINGGFDFYRCKLSLRTWGYASGHTDAFQTWGNHVRIHHNVILNWRNPMDDGGSDYCSIGLIQFSSTHNGDWLFYNNLIYDQDTNRFGAPGLKISQDAWNAPGKYAANNVLSNFWVVNNLFLKPNATIFSDYLTWVSQDASRGTNDLFTITNCGWINNIVMDSWRLGSGELQGDVMTVPNYTDTSPPNLDISGPITSDTNRFKLYNNVVTGPNFRFQGSNSIVEYAATRPGVIGNTTNRPRFFYYATDSISPAFDFHVAANDTVIKNAGFDVSPWTNDWPGFGVDLDGQPRFQGGAIDIGPYEFTPGLVLYYKFDDPWTNGGPILDWSGNTNHAYQYGHGNLTNWPTTATGTNGSLAGGFDRFSDATIPATGEAGRYGVITNYYFSAGFTQATFMVWAYFLGAASGGWSTENNQSFIDGGFGPTGGWQWGKNSTKAVTLYMWTNAAAPYNQAQAEEFLRWPDPTDANGLSTNWHHFAWVFDRGTNIAYYDGAPWQTNTDVASAGVTTLTNLGNFMCLGGKTHSSVIVASTPQFGDDNYPNHGWLHGRLDNLRGYGRAVGAQEIADVVIAEGTLLNGVPDSNPPPDPPAAPTGLRIIGKAIFSGKLILQ